MDWGSWSYLLLIAAAVGCKGTQAPDIECGNASVVDVVQHRVELTVTDAARSVTGRGEVTVRTRVSTRAVALDTHRLRVTQVMATGQKALPFKQTQDSVCIALPQLTAAGTKVALSLGWKVDGGGSGPHVGNDQIWAGYDAAAWMPTRQDPAQRATLELTIIAPREWKVIGPGRRLGGSRGGQPASADVAASAFEVSQPSPPFLFAFAAGQFEEAQLDVDGVHLRALGPRGADIGRALAITAPMLRFLIQRTGSAPPDAEYTQVFVQGDAAQEAAGFALLSAAALEDVAKDPKDDWIFVHELSHQWFGWQVACADFNDFWLNEGFATFLTAAYKEQRWGAEAYAQELEHWRQRSAKVHADGRDAPVSASSPGRPQLPSPKDSELPARGVTYSRGALVLHKLRADLGDELFWAGVRGYVASRGWKNARTEDLRAAMEAVSGKDLRPFFERWVYAPAADL
jgi:aminopeptidase N